VSNDVRDSVEPWNATFRDARRPSIWAELPFVERALPFLAGRAEGPVLEIPCGGGRNTGALAAGVPFLLAADRSRAALAVAQAMIDRERLTNCGLLEADINRLPFPDHSIDGVFCADLLGHLPEPADALGELVRVSRPGSRIVANFFAEDDPSRFDPKMVAIGDREYLYRGIYFRFDSEDHVRQLIEPTGTEILSIDRLTWREDPHEGYRDYPHEHRSVLTILEVRA
jgi:ubiquinone/menaquinone biosynthesis C-methylase UbiE